MQHTYSSACRGKQRHKTLGVAQAAIRSLERRGMVKDGERYRAYFCVFCRGYHAGHVGPNQWNKEHES